MFYGKSGTLMFAIYKKKCALTQSLIIDQIAQISAHGDLRIGQIIENARSVSGKVLNRTVPNVFGIADEDLLEGLIELNERCKEGEKVDS